MTRWKFRVSDTGSYVHRLALSSGSTQDFVVWKEEPEDGQISYWLSSPWLDGVTDPQQVSNRRSALACLVDGAIFLSSPSSSRLRLGGAVDVDTLDKIVLPEPSFFDGWNALRTPFAPQLSRGSTTLDAEEFGAALFLARHDENVRGCLLCLGYSGVNFVSLYQCRDFMNRQPQSKAVALTKSNVTKQVMKRFDHTANNFEASGPAGRHGEQGESPPDEPMSEGQAAAILLPVLRAFFVERANAVQIEKRWSELPE